MRTKRGGALTGPNPTDCGKLGTRYHVAVATDGQQLGAVPSAAKVHGTRLLRHLLRQAQVAFASFTYQAQSWSKPYRVMAKVEWHQSDCTRGSGSSSPVVIG